MSTDPLEDLDLDTAVAGVRSNMTDVRILLKVLAGQLADAVGAERLAVERAGRLRRSEEVRALTVAMGDDEFRAEVDGATLRCSVGHRSGGIRIRSEQVSADDWLKRLLQSLHAEAAHSEKARMALERIVIGGE
ncbi:MAG TPA: hypothetical protein VEJ21_05750 [Acidimicrobiales bacterium]|nr:hypothetical protein [Acidimicrobiales bacterium]